MNYAWRDRAFLQPGKCQALSRAGRSTARLHFPLAADRRDSRQADRLGNFRDGWRRRGGFILAQRRIAKARAGAARPPFEEDGMRMDRAPGRWRRRDCGGHNHLAEGVRTLRTRLGIVRRGCGRELPEGINASQASSRARRAAQARLGRLRRRHRPARA